MITRAFALIAVLAASAAAQGQLQCPGYPPRPIDGYSQRLLTATTPDVADVNFCKAYFSARYQACIVTRNYLRDIKNNATGGQIPCLSDDLFRRAATDPYRRFDDEKQQLFLAAQQQSSSR